MPALNSWPALLAGVRALDPVQFAEVERALRDARHRAELLVETDEAGMERDCPRCGGSDRQCWGRTRTGVQRHRCKGCGCTWSGLTGTAVERIHLRGPFLDALKDMMSDAPRSFRRADWSRRCSNACWCALPGKWRCQCSRS